MRLVPVFVLAALALVLLLAGAAPATTPHTLRQKALHAIAEASGRLDPAIAAAGRREVERAARLFPRLPAARSQPIQAALAQLAALAGRLTQPRAAILVGQLRENNDWFAGHGPPPPATDLHDADGIVYRWFPGGCLEFHPLANFGALNALAIAGNHDATQRLADALVARGTKLHTGGIGWEYEFGFGGGNAPWLSGMAQAVAAQAFERAASVVPEQASSYDAQARAAFDAIPGGLVTDVAAGPWIRLYSFNRVAVLNAQLQTVVSLTSYADAAGDGQAAALAARLQRSAATMLPRFDSGWWTNYALGGPPSPLDYQQYVVSLLKKLAGADPVFADAATRIAAYETQPPAFQVEDAGAGALRFWLSKPSNVRVESGAGPTRWLSLDGGWHTLRWPLPKRAGAYGVHVDATDYAGNRAGFDGLPIVRAVSVKPAKKRVVSDAAVPAASGLAVGAALDDPAQGARLRSLGLTVARLGVAWPNGAAAPDDATLQALRRLPARLRLVVELNADPTPLDDTGRTALAAYAAALAQSVPALTDLVLVPAPTVATAAAYTAALDAIHTAIETAAPSVAVDPLVEGAAAPKNVLAALAKAGLAAPTKIAFRPAPAPATGAWTLDDLAQLRVALTNRWSSVPPILVDGLALQSTFPADKASLYPNPLPAGALTPDAQASAYAQAVTAAGCDTGVTAIIVNRLDDDALGGDTSGLYYADGSPKPAAAAVEKAAVPAQRGASICPGAAAEAHATTFTPVSVLPSLGGASLTLACDRDCLYLALLVGGDGKPVAAARGSLTGGATPSVIRLPAVKLDPSLSYRLDVRLVARVNAGTLTRVVSPPITVG